MVCNQSPARHVSRSVLRPEFRGIPLHNGGDFGQKQAQRDSKAGGASTPTVPKRAAVGWGCIASNARHAVMPSCRRHVRCRGWIRFSSLEGLSYNIHPHAAAPRGEQLLGNRSWLAGADGAAV